MVSIGIGFVFDVLQAFMIFFNLNVIYSPKNDKKIKILPILTVLTVANHTSVYPTNYDRAI